MAVTDSEKKHDLDALWRRYKADGDEGARDELVLAYSPLVKYVAGRMGTGLPAHVEEEDLISYGLLGLMGALERFDLSRDIKFETYAVSRIKGSMIDELRALDWVPRSVRSWARRVERTVTKLENELKRAPSDAEIADELDITEAELENILTQISHASIVALDEFWTISDSGGDKITLMDTIEDSTSPEPAHEYGIQDMKDRLAEAIRRLPEREKIVIGLYYYDGLTLREIGEVLGVTESRTSQLHTKAILRLKGRIKNDLEPGRPVE